MVIFFGPRERRPRRDFVTTMDVAVALLVLLLVDELILDTGDRSMLVTLVI